jgi:beta-glucosidase
VDLPPFDKNATSVTYDRRYGQRLLDREGNEASYPLGFGLSYTSFVIRDVDVALSRDSGPPEVRATVETQTLAEGHVVQVYATRPESTERFLVGFARADVGPGERIPLTIDVPLERLSEWRGPGRWELRPGGYRIDVGGHAADPASVLTTVDIP